MKTGIMLNKLGVVFKVFKIRDDTFFSYLKNPNLRIDVLKTVLMVHSCTWLGF